MSRSLLVLGGSGDVPGRYLLPWPAALGATGALGWDVEIHAVSREPWADDDHRG